MTGAIGSQTAVESDADYGGQEPAAYVKKWQTELRFSEKAFHKWIERSEKIEKRYLDEHAVQAQARPKDVLIVANEFGPNSLDIHTVGANRAAYGVSWICYDRLMTYGKKTLPDGRVMYDRNKLEPELAESWQTAPDGSAVTFKLRKNAKFHDGTPVTAKDVKWSFDRAVSVGGFATFQMAAGSLEKPEQFEVVDEHTFRIKLLRKDKLTADTLKIVVNGSFGKLGSMYSALYAPELMIRQPSPGSCAC